MKYSHLILESFLAYERLNLIIPEKSRNADKSINDIEDLYLECQFLKKIQMDPGFRYFIYKKISGTNSRIILREFLYFLKDFADFIKMKKEFSNIKEIDSYIVNISDREPRYFSHRLLIGTSRLKFNTLKDEIIKFLYPTWIKMLKEGFYKKAAALESLFLELKTGYFMGYNPYLVEDTPMNTLQYGIYFKMLRRFFSNIDYFMYDFLQANTNALLYTKNTYNLLPSHIYTDLNYLFGYIIEHIEDVLDVNIETLDSSERNLILEIFSLIWWNNQTKDSRYSLLNQFYGYPFILEQLAKHQNKDIWYEINDNITSLFEYGVIGELKPFFPKSWFRIQKDDPKILQKFLICIFFFPEIKPEFEKFNYIRKEKLTHLIIKTKSGRYNWKTVQKWLLITGIEDSINAKSDYSDKVFKIFGYISRNHIISEFEKKNSVIYYLILNRIYNRHQEEILFLEKAIPSQFQETITKRQDVKSLFNHYFGFQKLPVFEKNKSLFSLFKYFFTSNNQFLDEYFEARYIEVSDEKSIPKFHEDLVNAQIILLSKTEAMQCFTSVSKRGQMLLEELKFEEDQTFFNLFEPIVFAKFYSKAFKRFLTLFEEYNDKSQKHHYFEQYRFLISIALDVDKKILYRELNEFFMKAKTKSVNNDESYHIYLDTLLFDLYLWKKQVFFTEFIANYTNSPIFAELSNYEQAEFYFTLGNSLADRGLTYESIPYYELSKKKAEKKFQIYQALGSIGTAYLESGDREKAIEYCKKAVSFSKAIYYLNFSRCYGNYKDFCNAILILKDGLNQKAIQDNFKQKYMLENELQQNKMKNSILLNLNSVSNKKALEHLKSASRFCNSAHSLLNISNNTSFIFTEIANGIDCLMQEFFNPCIEKYLQDHHPEEFIPKSIFEDLPRVVQNIRMGRSGGLGEWEWLFREILDEPNNSMLQKIRNYFPEKFTDGLMSILKEQLGILVSTRNPTSHGEIIPKERYFEIIQPYIRAANISIYICKEI